MHKSLTLPAVMRGEDELTDEEKTGRTKMRAMGKDHSRTKRRKK